MKVKKIIPVLSVGAIIGFISGFLLSFGQFKPSFINIVANRYIQYKMYRLLALNLQGFLNKWMIVTIIIPFLLFVIWLLWKLLCSNIIDISVKNKNKLRILVACIACSIFFFYGGWVINHYWLPHRFNLISLLVNVIILLFTVFLGWVLMKVEWEIITLVLVTPIAILNLGIIVDSKINVPKGPNVIIIVIDALRKDHLGIYGYRRQTTPNIDRFAQDAIVFQSAISNSSWTSPSVASFFSSLYPSTHGCVTLSYTSDGDVVVTDFLDSRIMTLAEMLKEEGYKTAAVVAHNAWVPKRLQFDQGFDVFKRCDQLEKQYKGRGVSEVNNTALPWIVKNKNRPFFVYLHYTNAHHPYPSPPPFNSFFKSSKIGQTDYKEIERKPPQVRDKAFWIDKYDNAIRYVDYSIGQLLKNLEEHGLLNNTIVVITADHGEAFGEHGSFEHASTLYNEQICIPLIIKFPREIKLPDIGNSQIQLIDVTALILSILNCRIPYSIDGWNLQQLSKEEALARRAVFSEFVSHYSTASLGIAKIAMLKDSFKSIYDVNKQELTEFYDLEKDKAEEKNIISIYPVKAKEFEEEIKSWYKLRLQKRKQLGIGRGSIKIEDEKTLNQLRALGYLQ